MRSRVWGWWARRRARAAAAPEFIRSSQARTWRITTVAVVAIVAFGGTGIALIQIVGEKSQRAASDRLRQQQIADAQAQDAAQTACTQRWANELTAQLNRLRELNVGVRDAQQDVFAAAATGNRAAIIGTLQREIAAERSYNAELRLNPVPPAPKYACAHVRPPPPYRPPPGPPSLQVSSPTAPTHSSRRQRPSSTSTVTVPGPTRTAAGPTTTRTVPGKAPAVTRTVTRTVTASPTCLVRLICS